MVGSDTLNDYELHVINTVVHGTRDLGFERIAGEVVHIDDYRDGDDPDDEAFGEAAYNLLPDDLKKNVDELAAKRARWTRSMIVRHIIRQAEQMQRGHKVKLSPFDLQRRDDDKTELMVALRVSMTEDTDRN